MKLHRKAGESFVGQPLAGAVVEIEKAQRTAGREAVVFHRIAVVLAGDVVPPCQKIPDGLVCASMAVFELFRIRPVCQRQELMPQTDAENGNPGPAQKGQLGDDGRVVPGISGAVSQQDAVRGKGEDFFGRSAGGNRGHAAVQRLEMAKDSVLDAEIPDHDMKAGEAGGKLSDGSGGHGRDGVFDFPPGQGKRVRRFRLSQGQPAVHDAPLPDPPGDGTGVHPEDARDSLLFQEGIQIRFAPEIGGLGTPFPDDVGAQMRLFAFKIGSVDPVIADQGKGLNYHLAEIAGIGQRFLITGHGRGKDHLSHTIAVQRRAEGLPLIAGAVFQLEIYCLLHKILPFVKKAPMSRAEGTAPFMNAFVHPWYYSIGENRGQGKSDANCDKLEN